MTRHTSTCWMGVYDDGGDEVWENVHMGREFSESILGFTCVPSCKISGKGVWNSEPYDQLAKSTIIINNAYHDQQMNNPHFFTFFSTYLLKNHRNA